MMGFADQSAPRSDNAHAIREAFLAESERLSATGSFAWNVATDELVCSEELYRIFGFEHNAAVSLDLLVGRVHPQDLLLLGQILREARDESTCWRFPAAKARS